MSDQLKVDDDWAREKAARQQAVPRPPPGSPRRALRALVALLAAAGIAMAILLLADREPRSETPAGGSTVRIEVRSMPQMTIHRDGKRLGTTPLSLAVPRGTAPITLEATWVEKRYSLAGAMTEVPRSNKRELVPDRDQTVDFTRGK